MHITRTFNNTNLQSLSTLVHILTDIQITDFISEISNLQFSEQTSSDTQEVAA